MNIAHSIRTLKPYSLYALLALIAFFPCLFLGQAYWVNDLLYQFGPFRQFLKEEILAKHFPLWNPYIFAGQPFFANPNSMACYLPNYLTLFFPTGFGMGLFYFLHMVLAGSGMHWWLKSLRLSDNSARIGALTYCLTGFFWWELVHLHILADYAWFPLLMGCLEKLRQEWAPRWAFSAGLVFAVIFDCGNFQSTTWIFYTALAYFIFRFVSWQAPEGAPTTAPWKRLGFVLIFAAWGALPLFVHLIPAKEFSDHSNRRPQGQTYENFQGTFSLKPSTNYEFLFPTLGVNGNQPIDTAIQLVTDQANVGNDFLACFGYMGIWAPFFFFLAFGRKDKKFLFFALGFMLFSLLTAWGRFFPLHRLLCDLLPAIDLSRAPVRFIESYLLFGCVLVAYGFQELEHRFEQKTGPTGTLMAAGAYALLLIVIAFSRPDQTWREMLGLALGMLGLFLWSSTQSWKTLGRWTLMVGLVLPLLLMGWNGYSTAPASNFNYSTNAPIFDHLKMESAENRYYFDQSLPYPVQTGSRYNAVPMPDNACISEKIRNFAGYSPIILTPVSELRDLPMKTQARLYNIRDLIFGRDMGDQAGYTKENLQTAYLYHSTDAPTYVNAPNQVRIAPDHENMLKMMALPDFDPTTQIAFDHPIPAQFSTQLPKEQAHVTYSMEETADSQTFQVVLDRNSWVTFSEAIYPGWKAYVDGQPADLYQANDFFRALFIHNGHHKVEFKYQPTWFYPLIGLFSLWVLSFVFYFVWLYASRAQRVMPNP